MDYKAKIITDINGDCFSDDCMALLQESDIIITNPPYSIKDKYIKMLVDYKKDFILILCGLSMSNISIFNLIKNKQLNISKRIRGDFKRIDGSIKNIPSHIYTSFEINKSDFPLSDKDISEFPKDDKLGLPVISYIKDIPDNYYDYMIVPLSFISKWNYKQFELIKLINTSINGKPTFKKVIIKRI